MELRVWIGTVQRIISGLSENTTSQEVIVALAQATGKTGRFTLVEKWRDYEKTLTPNECPLLVAQKFGDYAHEVQFILRQTGEATSQNRRLAEAKSPKPQRRRSALKKSISFSGGAQSSSPARSPKLQPLDGAIVEEENQADASCVTPQPRRSVPQPHPADAVVSAMKSTSPNSKATVETSLDHPSLRESSTPRTRQPSDTTAPLLNQKTERVRKSSKSRDRSADSQQRREARRQREAELRQRETAELMQTISNHERRLEDEKRKLNIIDRNISSVTVEEEQKWGKLYDCRDEISKALNTVQLLEVELDNYDEVLLSEEINVLLRKQKEMIEEKADLEHQIGEYELHLHNSREQSELLVHELDVQSVENEHLDVIIKQNEDDMVKLEKRVEEKKRFLLEAEDGYMSACDDLKEAGNSLEKRMQMLVELERELREYNLKTFISSGFGDKYNGDVKGRATAANKTRGLLV